MSPRVKRILRYAWASVVGAGYGMLTAAALCLLVVPVCFADGGKFVGHRPEHLWVNVLVQIALFIGPIVAPLVGAVVGLIWAIRRDQRDDATLVP
ncbi:MAG: hypothetical protein ACJ8F7_07365 [Gemmataceae bacterium]